MIAPTSRAKAVAAFGDGSGVTVLGGGTILMPEMNYGRLRPDRVLLLEHRGRVTEGAAEVSYNDRERYVAAKPKKARPTADVANE